MHPYSLINSYFLVFRSHKQKHIANSSSSGTISIVWSLRKRNKCHAIIHPIEHSTQITLFCLLSQSKYIVVFTTSRKYLTIWQFQLPRTSGNYDSTGCASKHGLSTAWYFCSTACGKDQLVCAVSMAQLILTTIHKSTTKQDSSTISIVRLCLALSIKFYREFREVENILRLSQILVCSVRTSAETWTIYNATCSDFS